jgi:broad specificity phosphatase PhoE
VKTTVWLARHGETPWAREDRYNGRSDIPLTASGRAQAERLAARLCGVPLTAVYCSSLKRCVETATACADPHNLVPIPRHAFAEVDYGKWDGMLRLEIVAQYPDLYAAWTADPVTVTPPQGESGLHALGRAALALRQIVVDDPGEAVLLVAH